MNRSALIANRTVGERSEGKSQRLCLRDEYDVEGALGQHAGKRTFAFANRECSRGFMPLNWDLRNRAVFVIVVAALVLVEIKQAIRSRINKQGDWISRFLDGELYFRTAGNDNQP